MRHEVAYRKLGRKTAHRLAMFRNMVTSLILCDRIETTLPKAKELRRWADWMVTLGKTGTLLARRRAAEIVQDNGALQKLFTTFADRYRARSGGYTRILQRGRRHGDAAAMAIIEYLPEEGIPQVREKVTTAAKKKQTKKVA